MASLNGKKRGLGCGKKVDWKVAPPKNLRNFGTFFFVVGFFGPLNLLYLLGRIYLLGICCLIGTCV